jgi:hypothetical protein
MQGDFVANIMLQKVPDKCNILIYPAKVEESSSQLKELLQKSIDE